MREQPKVRDGAETDRLVIEHVGFVVHVAKGFRGRGVPFEDLVGEGCVGLLSAAARYDPTVGVRFTTYAGHWVRKSMLSALDLQPRVVRVPRYARLRHGAATREISIEAPAPGAPRLRLGDTLSDRSADPPVVRVVADDAKERLRSALVRLSPRERLVLALRYGLEDDRPRTLGQVAERMALSRERIRQIEAEAIRRLRKAFDQSRGRPSAPATFARSAVRTASSGSITGSRSYCS